jgi:hypothetical protein
MCTHKPLHPIILHRYVKNNRIILLHTVLDIIFLITVAKNWNFKQTVVYWTRRWPQYNVKVIIPYFTLQNMNTYCPLHKTFMPNAKKDCVNVTISKTNHTLCTVHDHYCVFFSKITTARLMFLNYPRRGLKLPIPLAARSKAWSCGRLHAGSAGSNPAEAWLSFCFECCMLSGRGRYFGMITRPEESYWVWCVWVWSW